MLEALDDRLHRVKFTLAIRGHMQAYLLLRWLSSPLCAWIDREGNQ